MKDGRATPREHLLRIASHPHHRLETDNVVGQVAIACAIADLADALRERTSAEVTDP